MGKDFTSDIRKSLSSLPSLNATSSFENPYQEEATSVIPVRVRIDDIDDEIIEAKKKKKKKKEKFLEAIESTDDFIANSDLDLIADEFDAYVETFTYDDDYQLRNNIVSLGRKYGRETEVDEESSEISQAYAKQEKALDKLETALSSDIDKISDALMKMSASKYGSNSKNYTELVSAKKGYFDSHLNIIKERSKIAKDKIELTMKKKDKEGGGADTNSEFIANRAVQAAFSMNRGSLMSSIETYSGDDLMESYDEIATRALEEDEKKNASSNSKKFLYNDTDVSYIDFENKNIQEILLWDKEACKPVEFIAEDDDGIVYDEYPFPNIDNCSFEVMDQLMQATDNFSRTYTVRYV